jgi:hypothetical protein
MLARCPRQVRKIPGEKFSGIGAFVGGAMSFSTDRVFRAAKRRS